MKRQRRYYGGDSEGTGDIKARLWLLIAFVVVFFSAIILRLWYLQVVKSEYYRQLSESNRVRIVNIRPPRGVLYDRNNVPVAINLPSYTVTFTPEDAKKYPGVREKLASILGVPPDDFDRRIRAEINRNPYQPIRVRENATFEEVSKVEANKADLPGVMVQVELRRYYPYGEFASHLIGYIGKVTPEQQQMDEFKGLPPDFLVGQYGIEKAFDREIRGEAGKIGVEVDAVGRQLRNLYTVEPVAGEDVYLTIDSKAQKAAEDSLGEQAGAIVAIDPRNGEVLAMASRPGFDPNIFPLGLTSVQWRYLTQDEGHPLNNRALQGQFPPGSTFKLAMALAGLETGKADLTKTVNCNGSWGFGGRAFHCWNKKGHGTVALHKAIVESCDVFFYRLGNDMGIDNIAKYAKMLGLGQPTGIGLKEKGGLIPSTEWKKKARGQQWYPGETISCAIGQGYVSVTPIQLARMAATLTNGGTLYQPQVVRAVRSKDGGVMTFPTVSLGQAQVKKEDLDIIVDAMKGVVAEPGGTAHAAMSKYATVGGKTGTAQVVGLGAGKGAKYKDHAWFVAVAPMEDPKIAVCVLVEHGGHGGSTAAPLAKNVIEAYLRVDEESMREKQAKALGNMTGTVFKSMTGARFKNLTGASLKKAVIDRKAVMMANRTGVKPAGKPSPPAPLPKVEGSKEKR